MEQEHAFKGRYGEDFQQTILKLMLTDGGFAIKCCKWLQASYFENKYLSWAFTTIKNYWDEFHKSPSLPTMQNEARKYNPEEQKEYFATIKQIVNVSAYDDEYIRKHLTGFLRINIFVDNYTVASQIYNNQNQLDAPTYMIEKMRDLQQVDLNDDKLTDFKNMRDHMEQAEEDVKNAVPTGIEIIDNYMMGGMHKGSLTVLLGATGVGKSIYLINIAVSAMLANKKVLFIYHEDEENPTRLRFISRLTKIPYNKLFCHSCISPEEWAKINTAAALLEKSLVLKRLWGTHIYIEDVMDWAKLKKKEWDYDLIIDDYVQFIGSKDRKMFKNKYEEQSHTHVYLKQAALEMQVAALTVVQGNRESIKNSHRGLDLVRSTDISDCIDIARKSTNVITLNRSFDQQKNNEILFYLEKNKYGIGNKAVLCESDFNRICTHEPGKQRELLVGDNGINMDISENIISGIDEDKE